MVVRAAERRRHDVRLSREGAAASRRARCTCATARSTSSLTNEGYLAPGVPGTVRGLALAHKRFGKLPWKDVVMPAVQLAEERLRAVAGAGAQPRLQLFPTERNGSPSGGVMAKFPASVAAYGKPGGGTVGGGDRLVLSDLAQDAARDRHRRPRRLLQGLDRRSHRRGHGRQRRPDHEGGSRRLRGEGARARDRARSAATTSPRCRRPAPAASR